MNTSPTDSVDTFAQALKAAGDGLRLQILALLAQDSFAVQELCQIFTSKQSGMSHHLKVLSKAKLVDTRREGNTIFYRRSDENCSPALAKLRDAIYFSADELVLSDELRTQLNNTHQKRALTSTEFFINNAKAFKEQQELIAAHDVYACEVASLLNSGAIALEVGPGGGDFLTELSPRFKQVFALDSSEAMLNQSRKLCQQQGLNNIEFVHNDTSFCRALSSGLDCVVINMVLHHTPSPAAIFADVASAMKHGASLIVCELGAHDQDWVREACGDQWLGFASNDLKNWAEAQHLIEGASRYVALRNGFQIQIHQFFKQQS